MKVGALHPSKARHWASSGQGGSKGSGKGSTKLCWWSNGLAPGDGRCQTIGAKWPVCWVALVGTLLGESSEHVRKHHIAATNLQTICSLGRRGTIRMTRLPGLVEVHGWKGEGKG